MDKQQLQAECERQAKVIDYNGPDWLAIQQWAKARRWLLADQLLTEQPDVQASHNRGRAAMLNELLQLSEQYRSTGKD